MFPCADSQLFGSHKGWAVQPVAMHGVHGCPLHVQILGMQSVHMEFVRCHWMTAVKANHQASLMMNSRLIGPWSELMMYVPDQLAENAHYCWVWGHLLLKMREVQCTYLSPFNCWRKTSTSAVMAMKSCSLEWADCMSHMPQRCSGRSNLGSPADH